MSAEGDVRLSAERGGAAHRPDPGGGAAMVVRGALRQFEAELVLFRQTWRGSTLSAFLSPLLYLGAIGFGLGSLVDAGAGTASLSATGEATDVSYAAFLAPGLVAVTAVQVAGSESIFGTKARVDWRGTWVTAVGTPLMPADLALCHVLWCGFRGGLAALVYALVAAALGVLPLAAALTVVPVAVLGAVAVAGLMEAWIAAVAEDHVINAANRFVLIPMVLFSGVFFPVSQLPGWFRPVVWASPLWHAVVLGRRAALGQATPWPVAVHLLVLVGTGAVGLALAVRALRRRLLA